MRDNVGIENRGHERRRYVEGHDCHDNSGKVNLLGGKGAGEELSAQARQHKSDCNSGYTYNGVKHEIHAIERTYPFLVILHFALSIETHVCRGEAEREDLQREDELVRGLIDTILPFSNEGQEHRGINKVDKVFDNNVDIPKSSARLSLTTHSDTSSDMP